jgi:demethylmenaquinone methyltransferase/2-methoxy-6-polyprenyl-1,4-benzoquinol methylase
LLRCGTGLNFPLLQEAVGPDGRIIGVDLTDAMLDKARARVAANRWSNVELIQTDAAEFTFPQRVNGILSTFAITLVPEYDEVIRRGVEELVPGGRWVVLDFRIPSNRLVVFTPLALLVTKPFAVSLDLATRHPWESIKRYLENYSYVKLYGGFAYVASGERGHTMKLDV